MTREELLKELFKTFQGTVTTESLQESIIFHLDLLAQLSAPEDRKKIDSLIDDVIDKVNIDDFASYWMQIVGDELAESEMRKIVELFNSDLYKEVTLLMNRANPSVGKAIAAYAHAVVDKLLPPVSPNPAIMN